MTYHTKEEMEAMAKAHNMSIEEMNAHMKKHENMDFAATHEILLKKEFSDDELTEMAKEHGMTLVQLKEHIEMEKKHHSV
jgi:hypothetical protein